VQGRRYALDRRIPLVTSYHTHFPRYTAHYGVGALEPAVWRFITWFHRPARLTQTPGEHARRELAARGIIQAVVWGQGVDTRTFHHRHRDDLVRYRLGIGDDQVAVLHVGRLAAEKNLETLIAAWQQAHAVLGSAARFVIAGDGPMAARLAGDVPFAARLGFLPVEQLAALYASCDLCVLPSPTETCGLVALEAMASGLPVVAADAGGLAESVEHGVSGLRVAPRDVAGFAAAIGALVHDRRRRERMAAAARLTAVARDSAIEDAELLDQYAVIAGLETERDAWRAAS
jgi:glycosyltransferase involved in cell wall biosynthesis